MPDLEMLGWDDAWRADFEPFRREGLTPGRVVAQHRGAYDVATVEGELRATIAPRLRKEASVPELPVVGDWVALDTSAVIEAVVPRRTAFSRRAPQDPASDAAREQVVAANVDVVFIAVALSQDPDRLLLERYIALALESGARPVLLLTKADVEPDPAEVASAVADVGGGIPIEIVSARTGLGLDDVRAILKPGVTGALLGPSGVGKSTLVNALADDEVLATGETRNDGAGRHTTTRRQLVALPGGGLLIDNPGMREVHLWLSGGGLAEAFQDISELAAHCRFSDCSHETEPGCAVQAALADETLARERWDTYRALQRELVELEERLARRERSRARRGRPSAGAS